MQADSHRNAKAGRQAGKQASELRTAARGRDTGQGELQLQKDTPTKPQEHTQATNNKSTLPQATQTTTHATHARPFHLVQPAPTPIRTPPLDASLPDRACLSIVDSDF